MPPLKPRSDFDEATLGDAHFAQESEGESVFLVLRADAEAARGEPLGIRQRIGIEVALPEQRLDRRLEVSCALPDFFDRGQLALYSRQPAIDIGK